jgi:ubiquinone/menaquinone biosynthesis C-methylase UbiE
MELRKLLRNTYWKLEDIIDPETIDSHRFYADVVRDAIQPGSSWLEVGCGHEIFVPWVASAADLVQNCKLVVGIDYDFESLTKHREIENRVVGDLLNIPCGDEAFDRITANMVMEHVADPVKALKTMDRLLKPGGIFIFHTPNYWHYWTFLASLVPQKLKNKVIEFVEERSEDDVFPTFYRLNTPASITEAAHKAGLTIRHFHRVSSSSSGMIFVLGPLIVFSLLFRKLTRWKLLEDFRDNFVVVLEKPAVSGTDGETSKVAANSYASAGYS